MLNTRHNVVSNTQCFAHIVDIEHIVFCGLFQFWVVVDALDDDFVVAVNRLVHMLILLYLKRAEIGDTRPVLVEYQLDLGVVICPRVYLC